MASKRKELMLKRAVKKDFCAIALNSVPTSDTNTVALLNATGLTAYEIKAAVNGYRFGAVYGGKFYQITGVTYTSETAYSIALANASYEESTGSIVPSSGSTFITVTRANTTVTVNVETLS